MAASTVQLKEVDLSLIEISGANPRKDIKGESFKELKASIDEHGVIEPLVVRPKGDKYELVAGERRYTAAKELKLKMVPVSIRELDDHSARVIMLLENLQREDLAPLEEAAALQELLIPWGTPLGTPHITQEKLAKKLGKSQPWVANRLRLNKAPAEIKRLLTDGQITPQHVIALLPYTQHEQLIKPIVVELKNRLEGALKGFQEAVTVESLDGIIDDAVGQNMWPLDNFGWQHEGFSKFWDYSACDKCPHIISTADQNTVKAKKQERQCLQKDCYERHLKAAEEKKAATQKDKLSKATVINTDKMSYRDYRGLDDATFDKTACKECENHKMQKPRYAKFGKDKDELEEICLKPSCFQSKTAQKTRVTNAACREELAFVEESLKQYLESRPAGLTSRELTFILDQVDWIHTPKKVASVKDLESMLIRHAMTIELSDYKSSLNFASLKQVERSWPFEVKRKKPEEPASHKNVRERDPALVAREEHDAKIEPPTKKKVQEKRPKKKGAGA